MTSARNTFDKRVRVEVFTRDGQPRVFDQRLRIDFSVDRTKTSGEPASARITIYNLSDDSIGVIRARNAVIRLSAGFDEITGLIFTGTITRVAVDETSVDGKTEVEAEDGYARFSSVRVNRSWEATTAREVAQVLARDAGYILELPPATDLPDIEYPDGYTASGLWRTEFNEVIRSLGGEWAADGTLLQVVRRGEALQRRAVLISEATGMVGTPKETGSRNILVRTALNPAVKLKQIIRVDTAGRQIWAKVIKIKHQGTTWDGPFFTDIDARRINDR